MTLLSALAIWPQQARTVVFHVIKGLAQWNPYDPQRLRPSDLPPVTLETSSLRARTFQIVFVALFLFMVWASIAPLDNGVHMAGTVIVKGHRKAVQHPTGGVVVQLMVKEGQVVQEGEVLLRLNPLGTAASLEQTELDYITLMVVESRLLSERLEKAAVQWIPELSAWPSNDGRVTQAIQLQTQLFRTRRDAFLHEQSIVSEQMAAQEKQLRDLNEVLILKREQLMLLSADAKSNHELAREGYVSASRANEVERSRSDLLAAITQLGTEISRTQAQLAAGRLQLLQQRTSFNREVETQLTETQKNRQALKSRMQALAFDRDLSEVRSPIAGSVVGLKVFTEGGVVRGTDVLMEIVPQSGELIIDARVPPQFIDKVRTGLTAYARLTAFNVNTTPVVEGEVELVAADRTLSPDGRNEYYLSHIRMKPESLHALRHVQIQPGMPVEVIVKTGERTFLSYLLKPLSDRTAQAFKDPL